MLTSILDKHEFMDGRIVIYRRGDIGDKSNFSVRLRIPQMTGYIIRSSGSSDFYQARKFAEDLFDQLRLKVMNGESLKDRPFNKCVTDYAAHLDAQSFKSEKERKEVKAWFKNYPVRFFGTIAVGKINDAEIAKFIDWRMKNPIRRANVRVNSIRGELNTFRMFFVWAKKSGVIAGTPEMQKPKSEKARRPHFDRRDWQSLTKYLRKFIKHENATVRRDREMLCNYVLILANTGIRIGEARALKWRDVSQLPVGPGEKPNIALTVKGKTGVREVVARTPDVKDYFKRIYEIRIQELEVAPDIDSYVFCHKDGKPIQSFKKSFNTLIADAKVEKDTHGQRRTIYSLRHTYATFQLEEGVHQFILARNMGTSVAMLETFYGHNSSIASAGELTKNRPKGSICKADAAMDWLKN